MKKTLYSLMLSDDVVREVDRMAHRLGTSRSNLVNQVLAEYVDLKTPERRINEIFSAIEELMSPSRELVPFFAPNALTMSLKSSLEYKYRPTVKYEVELYRTVGESAGTLSVNFRTTSASLIEAMTRFFSLYKRIEDQYLAPLLGSAPRYALYEGRLERSLAPVSPDCSSELLAQALSDYISLFDVLLKGYLAGRCDPQEVERQYVRDLEKRAVLL